jgi:hypothetical protein
MPDPDLKGPKGSTVRLGVLDAFRHEYAGVPGALIDEIEAVKRRLDALEAEAAAYRRSESTRLRMEAVGLVFPGSNRHV